MSFLLNKKCDVCLVQIPDDYGNLLCFPCYDKQTKEIDQRKAEEVATKPVPETLQNAEQVKPAFGIEDEHYHENPEKEDKEQWTANIIQFEKSGKLLWHPTRFMYEHIKTFCMERALKHPQYPKYIWKPKIVDVGCGSGVGSNILSQEADFVWGIDKNVNSIKFAQEAFTRVKTGIYYSSQLTFDVFDITKDNRQTMQFDVVVAIEIFEHIYDIETFMKNMIGKFAKKDKSGKFDREDGTIFFISTPNRNNEQISKERPINQYHVREMTSGELVKFLSQFFEVVELANAKGEPIPPQEYETTKHTPILARCSFPKL